MSPRLADHQPDAASSSTDLSVLGFQPVGGVTKTEQEPVAPVRPNLAQADRRQIELPPSISGNDCGVTNSYPNLLPRRPHQSSPATGPIRPRTEARSCRPVHRPLWGSAANPSSPGRPIPTSSTRVELRRRPNQQGRSAGFSSSSCHRCGVSLRPPPSSREPISRGSQSRQALPLPLLERSWRNRSRRSQVGRPDRSAFVQPRGPKRRTPSGVEAGWASLAIATLSCVTYFRYRSRFKPRWWNRASLLEQADNRPSPSESWGSS